MAFTRYNSVYSNLTEAKKGQSKKSQVKKPNVSKTLTPKIPQPSGKKAKKLKKEEINGYFINLKRKLREMIEQDSNNEELYDQYNKVNQLHKKAMKSALESEETPASTSGLVSEVDDSYSFPKNKTEVTTYIPADIDQESDHYDTVMDNSVKEDDFDFSPEENNTDIVDYSSYHDEDSVDSYDTLMNKSELHNPNKENVYEDYEVVNDEDSEDDFSELDEDNTEKALKEARKIRENLLSISNKNKVSFKEEDKDEDDEDDEDDAATDSEDLPNDFTFPTEDDKEFHDPSKKGNLSDEDEDEDEDEFSFDETQFEGSDISKIMKAAQEIVSTIQDATETSDNDLDSNDNSESK